jgi:hypothetical protein
MLMRLSKNATVGEKVVCLGDGEDQLGAVGALWRARVL